MQGTLDSQVSNELRARFAAAWNFRATLDEPPARDRDERERPRRHRAIWVSDTHLGTKDTEAAMLLEFLERNDADYLYLVGDIIDGWALRKSWIWPEAHNAVIQCILEKASQGTRVVYIAGNHDEFLRSYAGLRAGGVVFKDEYIHVTAEGKQLLVLHGDQFDAVIRNAKWLAFLGDKAYRLCLMLNRHYNRVRQLMGYEYWSLSAFLKHKVKEAVSFIGKFEEAVASEVKRRGLDGVVCGHIHQAELREIDGILYCNDGDWVESCTAMVENDAGKLEIIHWPTVREEARRQAAEEAVA